MEMPAEDEEWMHTRGGKRFGDGLPMAMAPVVRERDHGRKRQRKGAQTLPFMSKVLGSELEDAFHKAELGYNDVDGVDDWKASAKMFAVLPNSHETGGGTLLAYRTRKGQVLFMGEYGKMVLVDETVQADFPIRLSADGKTLVLDWRVGHLNQTYLSFLVGKPHAVLGDKRPSYHIQVDGGYVLHFTVQEQDEGFAHVDGMSSCVLEGAHDEAVYMLVNNRCNDVVMAKDCSICDWISVNSRFGMVSPKYTWPMHTHEMRNMHRQKFVLSKLPAPPPGERPFTLGNSLKSQNTFVTPLIEAAKEANMGPASVRMECVRRTIAGAELRISIGMGFATEGGQVGQVMALGESGDIVQFRLYRTQEQLPVGVLRGLKSEEIVATTTTRSLKPSEVAAFNREVRQTFLILPWCMRTMADKTGKGNRVVMGYIDTSGNADVLHGLVGLSAKDVLKCVVRLACAYYDVGDRIVHGILGFVRRCAKDDSYRSDSLQGAKANTLALVDMDGLEVSAWVARTLQRDAVPRVEGSMLVLDVACLRRFAQVLPDATIDDGFHAVRLPLPAHVGGYIEITGPVAFKIDFNPFPQATMTVDAWEHCGGLIGIRLGGTSLLSKASRARERKARPHTVWNKCLRRQPECEDCFPRVCSCDDE